MPSTHQEEPNISIRFKSTFLKNTDLRISKFPTAT